MTTRSNDVTGFASQAEHGPSSDDSEWVAKFWNRIAESYAAKPVANEEAYARKLAITRSYLKPDSEVLELGCGTGSTALVHAPYVRHIRATDFAPKMIAIARRKAAAADVDNIDFVCGAIDSECAANKTYDAILALSVLHLLVDWPAAVKAAHQMLKPGGVFVTSTLCLKDSHPWLRWFTSIGASVRLLPQLSVFTRKDFESVMVDAGFSIEHAWLPAPGTGLFLVARKPS